MLRVIYIDICIVEGFEKIYFGNTLDISLCILNIISLINFN